MDFVKLIKLFLEVLPVLLEFFRKLSPQDQQKLVESLKAARDGGNE